VKKTFFEDKYLVTALFIAMIVAATEVPSWLVLFSAVMVAWKFLNEKMQVPKLSVKLTPIFGFALFAIVYLQYRTIFGQEESATILLGLTAITILNFEKNRDKLFLVLLGFMIVVLKSVFSTDVIWMIPTTVAFFGLWMALIPNERVNRPKFVYHTFLRALPVLVILFLVFPRIILFETKQTYNSVAQSGFSEDMTPGQFERVATSDQIVFRAEFSDNSKIKKKNLYWRGGVLKNSNGFSWFKDKIKNEIPLPIEKDDRETISYKVVLEPLNMKNIFVLESPLRVYDNNLPLFSNSDLVYRQAERQTQVLQYSGESSFATNLPATQDSLTDEKYLKSGPLQEKSQALIEKIKSVSALPKLRLQELESFFKSNQFIYTLNPDVYGNDLDQFLFVRKKGFCEHYAAAFATLARHLGVRSRVVIKYQGGTYNSLGNFWQVSQKDAHAWVEVLLDNSWERVDPTSFVSPLRISLGSQEYFSLSDSERKNLDLQGHLNRSTRFVDLSNSVVAFFESINYKWTLFLLDYDSQRQLEILKSVQVWWFYVLLAFMLPVLIWFYIKRTQKKSLSKKHEFYLLFIEIENWCRKNKIQISKSSTPLSILKKIEISFVKEFSQDYERVVYEEKPPLKSYKWWRKRWKSVLK
jgi:protein-glutamine gamma-glutamyltransferase